MSAVTAAPRVVIAGAGPGGLAAASLLRQAGAIVTVLERSTSAAANPARRTGAVLGREAWDLLRRVGGGSLLDDSRNAVGERAQLISLRAFDETLSASAESLGATIRRGVDVGDVVDHGSHVSVAVQDAKTGARELLDADWYVDATGGRSAITSEPRFKRVVGAGPMQLLPEKRPYLVVQATSVESRGPGWSAPDGAFAINNRSEGILGAYRGYDELDLGGRSLEDAGRDLLRTLDVDPETMVGTPYTVTARQSLAPRASEGRILLVGDSVGSMIPVMQGGTSLALLDGERAATAIVQAHRAGATTAAAGRIIDDYGTTTRLMHQWYVR